MSVLYIDEMWTRTRAEMTKTVGPSHFNRNPTQNSLRININYCKLLSDQDIKLTVLIMGQWHMMDRDTLDGLELHSSFFCCIHFPSPGNRVTPV